MEGLRRFQSAMTDKGCAADLGNQFLFAVLFAAKVCRRFQSRKPFHMACAVNHFMEGGSVILGSLGELCQERKHNPICGGLIKSGIPFGMFQTDALTLHICGDDAFRSFVCGCAVRHGLRVLCRDPFALVDVENVVVFQEGNLLLFLRVFVNHRQELPENHDVRFFTLPHVPAFLLCLLESDVLAGTTQEHLIQQGVTLAGRVADCRAACDPRLFPRDDSGNRGRMFPLPWFVMIPW